MSVIGELALSALFQVLFNKITSPDLSKIFHKEKVDADIKMWKTTLLKIHAVLDDADERQIASKLVKVWLDELRDLAYDVEDILDEFATEALRCKLNAETSTTNKVRKLIPVCCVGLNPSSVMFDADMRSKIKDINTRLQEIVTQKNDLQLRDFVRERTGTSRPKLPTTSLVEGLVYGRKEDQNAIVDLLLSSELHNAQLSVIPIVGMGGLGKTTLAQQVYNDDEVKGYFDLKAWVCVSEDFDIVRVTKVILQSVTTEICDVNDLNLLQIKLKERLYGKKFLLILDDVWNDNYNDWTRLRCPFEFGAPGSKILITTQNDRVSSIMGTTQAYKLKELSNDACLTVFTQNALGTTSFGAHPELEEISRKVLERCKGLPLAAKALGGLLRTIPDCDEWKYVLNSKIWDMSAENNDVLPTLRLSYLYLPSNLKRCFAYCSLFPKDYEFEEKELVLLWMAEGLLQEIGHKPMEDLGAEYFRDLHRRSFFQQSSRNKSLFVMHDLINDLAQWAAGDLCYRLEDKLGGDKQLNISTKLRHFSYIRCYYDGITRCEDFPKDKHLRTFLPLPIENSGYLTNFVPNCLLPQLRCLRVLSLCGYEIVELPSSIGDLKHLRYLNISYTLIRSLPESTSSLYNLQTLILKGCSRLIKLPEKIGNLVNLRHLDITETHSIKEMPVGIKELKNLQTLSDFVVGKDTGSKIGDLMNLKSLHGTLRISHLENMLDAEDARKANLNGKKNLDALVMKWEFAHDDLQEAGIAIDVLDMLQPWTTVKELSIDGYVGVKFPAWFGHPSFSNMVLLRIENCRKCTSLPAIGQLPSLKDLVLIGMAGVRSVGPEFFGEGCLKSFQSLETLHFEDMQEWHEWIPCGLEYEEFPHLRELFIFECPKLQGKLPLHLPSLENLSVCKCEQLVVSIPILPMLHELEIVGCKEVLSESMVELSSLHSIVFSIPDLKSLTEEFILGLTKVKNLTINDCKELTSLCPDTLMSLVTLDIRLCPSLNNISLTSTLRTLKIDGCSALKSLPMSNCTCLKYATIRKCNSLTFISRGQLPPTLKGLYIYNCENLQFVVDEGEASSPSSLMNGENFNCNNNNNASHLELLEIRDCPSLKHLSSRGNLPTMLKHLEIWRCSELKSLSPMDQLPTSLKHLSVRFCPKLESIVDKLQNNVSLEQLRLVYCKKLKSIPEGLHRLCHLNEINIRGCSSLVSFPDGGLLPTSLRKVLIEDCEKLEALPNCMHKLSSLQQLSIWECPSIISFPEEGYPTNLRVLSLTGVNICKQVFKWGLHRLTSLTDLSIYGGFPELKSFPEEDEDGKLMMMLPTSLTTLEIAKFPNIGFLSSKGFQNLTALEELWIFYCPKLASLPEGLPPSLLKLRIYECPLLKQHCKKGKGREWFKIAHIPRVEIDWRSVYEVEEEQQ
ncbi:putative disease resistance RPP13-like protein 1 [Castanea sativa]|uniref:putative disease resistance RPP13-like protein 1 n=1 Tax=Castanea sativa TaxID=21020 RepID=UPI003F653B8A